jgi:hypothetical protein
MINLSGEGMKIHASNLVTGKVKWSLEGEWPPGSKINPDTGVLFIPGPDGPLKEVWWKRLLKWRLE